MARRAAKPASRRLARAAEVGARILDRVARRLSGGHTTVTPAMEQRVDDLYVDLLDRHIDESARRELRSHLAAGLSLDALAVQIAQSSEYMNRVAQRQAQPDLQHQRLERSARALLGRPMDDYGRRYYESLLAGGASLDDVLLLLAESDEHENRVLRKHITIADLRTIAPERFVEVTPNDGGETEQLLCIDAPDDFDWLEKQLGSHGYYERPGVWGHAVTMEKRVMAEVVAALVGRGGSVLELGCANGVLLDLLCDLGVEAEGIDVSEAALRRASDNARPRIHVGDIGAVQLDGEFDAVVAFDILEHLNPNRLEGYLDRMRDWIKPGGFLIANLPAFGHDAVFGEVFPIRFDAWERDARAGRLFSLMQLEEDGWPTHGHLIWADTHWWQRQFARAGLARESDAEIAIRARYGTFLQETARARLSLYVLSNDAHPARVREAIERIEACPAADALEDRGRTS